MQCGISTKSSVAEFLSAMAAGYNAKLTVEAWKSDDKINGESIATSIGLAIATKHNRGRYAFQSSILFVPIFIRCLMRHNYFLRK